MKYDSLSNIRLKISSSDRKENKIVESKTMMKAIYVSSPVDLPQIPQSCCENGVGFLKKAIKRVATNAKVINKNSELSVNKDLNSTIKGAAKIEAPVTSTNIFGKFIGS
jgi:hypothetical protein